MKTIKNIKMVITSVFLLILNYGCEKAPLSTDIEGHWKLEKYTILDTGETVDCQHLYYGITHMVTEVARKAGDDKDVTYISRTSFQEDFSILVLSNFKVHGYNVDTGIDATIEQLEPFGKLNPLETIFKITHVSDRKMILISDVAQLELTKF